MSTPLRTIISFCAYHIYMAMPWALARHCDWMLPAVGDWAYRDERRALWGDRS